MPLICVVVDEAISIAREIAGVDTFPWSFPCRTRSVFPVAMNWGQSWSKSSSTGLACERSDIAAASAPNTNGFYNVHAGSLWVGSTSVAINHDGGNTWAVDPLGGIPFEDRPWIAADGVPSMSPITRSLTR